MTDSDKTTWPVKPGERLKRRQLHSMVGGAHQWGITSCLNGSAVLAFSNPVRARQFGYDRWEGWRTENVFHYTGQGTVGSQEVTSGANRSLLRTQSQGKPIHLFESDRTDVTYLGEFRLAEDPFRWEVAPDKNGNLRQVVVFHLVHVEPDQR